MSRPNYLRRSAALAGEKLYDPLVPCSRGHKAMRRVDNGSCVVCLDQSSKNFAKNNRDAVNARRRQHRLENPNLYEQKKQGEGFKLNVKRQSIRRVKNGTAAFTRMHGRMTELNRHASWDKELTDFACKEAHSLARARDEATGIKWSVDHIVPINSKKVSGLHVWNNLQVIPMQVNRIKHTRLEF